MADALRGPFELTGKFGEAHHAKTFGTAKRAFEIQF